MTESSSTSGNGAQAVILGELSNLSNDEIMSLATFGCSSRVYLFSEVRKFERDDNNAMFVCMRDNLKIHVPTEAAFEALKLSKAKYDLYIGSLSTLANNEISIRRQLEEQHAALIAELTAKEAALRDGFVETLRQEMAASLAEPKADLEKTARYTKELAAELKTTLTSAETHCRQMTERVFDQTERTHDMLEKALSRAKLLEKKSETILKAFEQFITDEA